MNHLLADLGIYQEYNPALDINLLADADGVIWRHVCYLNGQDNYTPHVAPRGATPITLASGELIGWARFHVSKDIQAYNIMPMPSIAICKPGDLIGPETTAITQLPVRRDRAGNPTLIAPSRAAVTDARDIVLFRDPPALRTSVMLYGSQVWFELSTEKFFMEDPDGHRSDIPRDVIVHYLMIGANYGQHRNAPAPLHGGAAQSARYGSGASPAQIANAAQGAIAAQRAASQQAGAGAGVMGLGGVTIQQLEEMLLQYKAISEKGKLPRTDPVVGEIVAWRAWGMTVPLREEDPVYLTSIYRTEVGWHPGAPLVSPPPADYGDIGIHAHKSRETLLTYVQAAYSTKLLVIGRVRLWGEVVEGETGYRAEFAQVESLEEILCPKFGGWRDIDWDGDRSPYLRSPAELAVSDQQLLDKLREVYGVN